MEKTENGWLKFLKKIGLVLGFTVFLVVTLLLSFKYFEASSEREVPTPPPWFLPVFITLPDKFEIVRLHELEEFKSKNSNYSYLVQTDNLAAINQQLVEEYYKKNPDSVPQIKVEQMSGEKQIVQVHFGGQGLLEHRYEATEKDFKSLTYKFEGAGFVFGPCCVTGLIGFIVYCLLRFVLWYLKRTQKKAEEIGE